MSSRKRVLVIEDEYSIRKYLYRSLTEKNYQVLEATGGEEALRVIVDHKPDLVILDLGLPDISGQEVLRAIREWSKVPVLILTAQTSDLEKVCLLDSGADDYLTKPFSLSELLARLRVMERHSLWKSDSPCFESDWLKVDYSSHLVSVDGKPIKVTATEYEMLKILAQNAGKLVTQRQLLSEIWGPGSIEQTHYLRIYVTQIRKKIERNPSQPQLLLTEPGVGYRLMII